MQQMGKIMDPVDQKIHRDLQQAKFSIDLLDVIKDKTRGNLTDLERDFLEKVLFELHMNYVDEAKASPPEDDSGRAEQKDQAPGDGDGEDEGQPGEQSAEEGDKN